MAILVVSFVGCYVVASVVLEGASATMGAMSDSMRDVNEGIAEARAEAETAYAEQAAELERARLNAQMVADQERQRREQDRAAYDRLITSVVDRLYIDNAEVGTASEFSLSRNTLNMTLTNESDYPIERFYGHAVIYGQGRSIPYSEGDFNYKIPGGLEPGESKDFSLVPNAFFGELGTIKVPEDALLDVEVADADWPDKPEKPLGFYQP